MSPGTLSCVPCLHMLTVTSINDNVLNFYFFQDTRYAYNFSTSHKRYVTYLPNTKQQNDKDNN